MRLENRAICVNKEGDRFVEEMERRDVSPTPSKEQTDGIGYMIFNQDGLDHTDIATVNAAEMDGLFRRGQLAKGETIAEACEPFGIDAAELQKTVEKWNGYCKDGADPDFNYRARRSIPSRAALTTSWRTSRRCTTPWAACTSIPTRRCSIAAARPSRPVRGRRAGRP